MMRPGESLVIELEGLARLVRVLGDRGFLVIGPTVRSGAIVYDVLESADDLRVGYTDVQEPGRYRLEQRGDDARFGFAVGRSRGSASCMRSRSRIACCSAAPASASRCRPAPRSAPATTSR
jgi:sulfhydrogenase subunit beta (sulfur reductase)